MHSSINWCIDFFAGDCLKAELKSHTACYLSQSFDLLSSEQYQLSRAAGVKTTNVIPDSIVDANNHDNLHSLELAYQSAGTDKQKLLALIKQAPFYPDPLLLWALTALFPSVQKTAERRLLMQRVGTLLQQRFPQRIDLLYSLVAAENANDVLKSLPDNFMPATAFYSNTQPALIHLQSLWAKGRYNQLLLTYAHYQSTGRYFASSDFVCVATQ